ncbi:hypothetical protein PanWU01x14_327690 [Parasponia andersonii]|uniref:Uncharacterized protein n=1 Tax=Parasponia andersonii TaxID=3476 RepID=A0A2P5AJ50_PARAD|nr:hypothetical protein PanWU01x14_327690 [Parasponia andersonii]
MSTLKEEKNQRKTTEPNKGVISWQERKHLADKEEEALKQDIEELKTWEYIEKRPVKLKTVKIQKSNLRPKVERIGKSRTSSASNIGIMASVWKFHKDDDEKYLNVKSDLV